MELLRARRKNFLKLPVQRSLIVAIPHQFAGWKANTQKTRKLKTRRYWMGQEWATGGPWGIPRSKFRSLANFGLFELADHWPAGGTDFAIGILWTGFVLWCASSIEPETVWPSECFSRFRSVRKCKGFQSSAYAAVAQWIEYWPPKPRVVGSIPASRTTI